jgi:DNA modification methylase
MIATSPPYWGLRSYDTGANKAAELGAEPLHDCLAWARGDAPCGACYVCNLRTWAAEMWRVLRDDGTLWLNLGDSYSSGVTGVLETINHLVKGADVFFFDSLPVAITAQSVDVTLDDQRAKQGEFFSLLRPEWIGVEDGDDGFHEVLDFLAPPRDARHSGPDSVMSGNSSTSNLVQKIFDCRRVVISDLNSNSKPEFAVLSAAATRPGKNNDTPLPIEEAGEPRAEGAIRWHTGWNTFAGAAGRKGIPDVNLVNQSIALRNGLLPVAGLLSDFRITKASEQQVTLKSIGGGLVFTVTDVRHLRFSFGDGRIIPYSVLHAQANKLAAMSQPKQEMGIPDSVKKALQADGWICRSTIIWAKPNPMPESVTDRPTKAHEYVFLLTKSARYFWDAEAVKENATETSGWAKQRAKGEDTWTYTRPVNDRAPNNSNGQGGTFGTQGRRNIRTVWNIATAPYSGAHFATWPPALVETMVKAGTSERGVCPTCGAPWRRVVDKGEAVNAPRNPNDALPYTANGSTNHGNGATTLHKARTVETVEWRPTCAHADASPIPAIVLDPFCGSGTTLLVARQLGRVGLGFDLSETYLRDNAAVRLGHDKLAAWGRGIVDTGDYTDLFRAHANGNGARSDKP